MSAPEDEKTIAVYDAKGAAGPVEPSPRTLLPAPLASLITYGTNGASLFIKGGTKIAGWAIAGSRESTLTSIELTRAAVEIILTRAGKDVSDRRNTELGRAEAANILEKSISAWHFSISSASFFASSFFYAGTASVNAISGLSINGLSTLNAIFGCTETSRAVATIITLVRSEFRGEIGDSGATVTYWDLLVGIIGFVLLQRWGRRKTERAFRENGGEEIIWDTIVDDRGFRADVIGTQKTQYFTTDDEGDKEGIHRARSFISPSGDEEIDVVERTGAATPKALNISLSPIEQARLTDDEIKQHIVSQLPSGVHATITSETVTAKTIRVDIFNTEMADISAPPGTVLIAESVHHPRNGLNSNGEHTSDGLHQQTVVFQTSLRRSNSSSMKPIDQLRMTPSHSLDSEIEDPEDALIMVDSPQTSPRNSPTQTIPQRQGAHGSKRSLPTNAITSAAVANQKKARKPASPSSNPKEKSRGGKLSLGVSAGWAKVTQTDKAERNGPLKKVMKNLNPGSSSTDATNKVSTAHTQKGLVPSSSQGQEQSTNSTEASQSRLPRLTTDQRRPLVLNKSLPPSPPHDKAALKRRSLPPSAESPRAQNQTGYYAVRESRRNSLVSQVDTYSMQSHHSRSVSPTISRTGTRGSNGLSKATSDRNIAAQGAGDENLGRSQSHRRSRSFIQSLYSVATAGSEGSLIVQPRTPVPQRSIYDDHDTILALAREGKTPGIFPDAHLVQNIRRYHRFSSASYGSNFLRFMGLVAPDAAKNAISDLQKAERHHDEHASFSMHTGLPPETIIFSSFADPIEGPTASDPGSAHPLVHFVSIDHDFQAVVLTCRGTLGIQDVLTDMICDYDTLHWRGTNYQVHRGILASARRLIEGPGSRVFATLKHAMEEYPDYGLVLTGHSLGGAVAAVLGILIAEPSNVEKSGALFATATPQKLIASTSTADRTPPVILPPNRPLHVYAYGPPATLSSSLRLATRGLITSTVNSNDIVPSLSLGNLQDMRNVALTLKSEGSDAIRQVSARVWSQVVSALRHSFYVKDPPPLEETGGLAGKNGGVGGDPWAWAALKTLRACLTGEKLVPPGEVFVVESMRVIDRQGTAARAGPSVNTTGSVDDEIQQISLGRPATRIQLKYIRDVETRFREVRFGSGMFADHSPTRYEANLAALAMGVVEEDGKF
ncbi:MAG: hypothetical protein Q9227_007145 [Pyrenula ochraceoflavens]